MEPLDPQVWSALEHKGLEAVKRSSNPDGVLIRLHLAVLPSFGNPRSWTLLEHPQADPLERWTGQRVCWERGDDYQRFEKLSHPSDSLTKLRFRYKGVPTFEPTLSHQVEPLETAFIEDWFLRLSKIQVSLSIDTIGGLDGTSFEMKLGHFWNALRLRWWEEFPDSWRPIQSLTRELLEVLGDSYDA